MFIQFIKFKNNNLNKKNLINSLIIKKIYNKITYCYQYKTINNFTLFVIILCYDNYLVICYNIF